MDSYQSLSASVYDFDKPVGKSFGDIEYYYSRLKDSAQSILEPAVGTGRLFIPLLERGFDVKGFDLSLSMLDLCKKNLVEHGFPTNTIKQASFTNFKYLEQFDAIIIPSGTFLLMTCDHDIEQALKNFHTHLKQNGKLVFDLFFPNQFKVGRNSTKVFEISKDEKISLNILDSHISYMDQITTNIHRYEQWESNQLVRTELEIFKLKWFKLNEIEYLLEKFGFSEISFSANYSYLDQVKEDSEIFTVEAIKK